VPSLSTSCGWLAAFLIVATASVPLLHRLIAQRRAAPDSRVTQVHVALGLATAAMAMLHTLVILPSLGSPAAVGGGSLALGPGALAVFLLMAHVGVGLQLRSPRLKDRAKKRRLHVLLALGIALAAAAHVVAVRRAGGASAEQGP